MSSVINTNDITNAKKDESITDAKIVDMANSKAAAPAGEEELTKVSYLQLFRYSTVTEKIMIFFGLIGAVIQGCSLPIMIKVMGKIIELYVAFVATLTIKRLGDVEDDNVLKELFDALTSPNKTAMDDFLGRHPEINVTKFSEGFADSDYGSMNPEEVDFSQYYKPSDEFWDDMYTYIIYFAIIGVVTFIGAYLMNAYLSISSTRQTTKIRALTFKSIVKQDIAWHEHTSPGELASRIISDSIIIEDGIGMKLGMLINSVVTFIACFIMAYTAGWQLSLAMSVIIPILLVVVSFMGVILRKYTKKSQDAYAEIGGIAQEAFSQIRTIVSFGTEQKEIDRYFDKLKPTKKYGIIKAHTLGICLGLVFCIIYSSFAIAFIYGTHLIKNGINTSGDILNVFMGIMMGSMTISGVGNIMSSFGESIGAAQKIFAIIERKPAIDIEAGEIPSKSTDGMIEFKDVRFNYPARPDVEVLKGISFKCMPGQTVALVGASGSGKSTTVQLLERFYSKKSGRILIDGKDIEDYNIKWLRSQIGLVSQEPTLFDASVAKNIAINTPDATQEQIENAAKLANAHDFIKKLSNGYDTSTGERGLQLSGGQKQRICIARALMKNPRILLLDEATSALDNQSEKIVQAALDSAASGRTTLVIAHRLSTIRNADLIIVMEKGIIMESGTHDELMKQEKIYYNLVKNQSMNVQKEEEPESDEEEAKGPDDIQQTTFVEPATTTRRETTILSRISSNLSMSRRRTTTGALSTASSDGKGVVRSDKYSTKNMPWGRYIEINKPFWLSNLLGLIGASFNGAIQPAFAFIFSSAINVFNKQGDDLIDGGVFWGMMFIVLGVANFVFFYCQLGGFATAGENLSYVLRSRMYDSMIRQEVGFFDTNDIGDGSEGPGGGGPGGSTVSTGTLTAKLATEAGLVNGLNGNIGALFQQAVTVITGFTIAFICGWKLTLILLIAVPFLFIGSFLQMASIKNKSEENRRVFENSSKIACEAIVSIKTVAALSLEDYFDKLYEEKLDEPVKRLERKAYISSIGSGFSSSVMFFAMILAYWVGSIFIENGELEFDNMFKVIMAVMFTAMAVGQLSSIAPDSDKAMEAFLHVLEILDRKPKINASDPSGIKKDVSELKGDISFNELRFRYPSRPKVTVLRMGDKKIEIPAGKKCAFVGGSGCGKSTIIGLLPRWYDAGHGNIKVDGEENKNYNIKWLREQIGIVNQEPCLFNISIKENIRYGKHDATDEEIMEAAKKANIHEFIMSLPNQYDTEVGGMGTSRMSGGQKQRIAIARAMIRNPKILLLDEATSALDAESELVVQNALEDASEGRTTITIAHRLSTIKDSDIICVFLDGRIIEMGKHEELMEKKGEYYNMVLAGDGSVAKGNAIAKKVEAGHNKTE